jgi:thiamine-monophosphate kinase
MLSEFELIGRFFTRATSQAVLGVGDDAALLRPSPGMELAVSCDMLVVGRHFLADTDPRQLGWKTLAVNLSDMAAMGAQPRWALLSIALPQADESWLTDFSRGFFECAESFNVELVGGDTTRGSLAMSVTILGEVPAGKALRRDGAGIDDQIWVSGRLGDAALALAALQGRVGLNGAELCDCLPALNMPQPRVSLGLALRSFASAAIDISDGLYGDLGHILQRSGVGAELHLADLPCSAVLGAHLNEDIGLHCLLAGGDDYELCFTAPPGFEHDIRALGRLLGLPLARIGRIVDGSGIRLLDERGQLMAYEGKGFDHFA